NRLGFTLEALPDFRRSGKVRWQDLHGDVALQPRVPGLVNLAHRARADRGKDLVGTQLRAGRERHVYPYPLRSPEICGDCMPPGESSDRPEELLAPVLVEDAARFLSAGLGALDESVELPFPAQALEPGVRAQCVRHGVTTLDRLRERLQRPRVTNVGLAGR